jgi:hypothetical protein
MLIGLLLKKKERKKLKNENEPENKLKAFQKINCSICNKFCK